MATVRLIHWNEHEGLERQRQLEALGYNVRFDGGDGTMVMPSLKAAAHWASTRDSQSACWAHQPDLPTRARAGPALAFKRRK